MKRLLTFVLIFMIASALFAGISFGAGEERFVFSDLTAKDKKTGLMWTRDANIAGRRMHWDEANDYIRQLNKQKYAGYTDWRLPSKEELGTFTDYAKGKGYKVAKDFHQLLSKVGFRNVLADGYWSSSTSAYDTTYAWCVLMSVDLEFARSKTGSCYVWPVRAGQ